MNKPKSIDSRAARLIMLPALLLPLSLLLPYISIPGAEGLSFTRSGFDMLFSDKNILHILPLLIPAGLAFVFALFTLKVRRLALRLTAMGFVLSILTFLYALLSAKTTADASGLLPAPFLVRHLQFGFWLYLIFALLGLIFSLMALRMPTTYIVLTLMAAVWLLPILWLIITSFRAERGAYTTYIIPKGWTLSNYARLFSETNQFNFPRWYLNTLFVSVITCGATTMMVLMISYTFSRLRFPSRRLLMNIGLVVAMFPGFMSMIAVYHILKAVGLAKSLSSLILVYTGGGFSITPSPKDSLTPSRVPSMRQPPLTVRRKTQCSGALPSPLPSRSWSIRPLPPLSRPG